MITFRLSQRVSSYAANLSIYFLASLIPMLLSLVSNPFVAKNMSPHDYAIVGYYSAFVTLFTPFINFFFAHYYTKRFYELNDGEKTILKATIFKSFISLSFVMALGAMGILLMYNILANKSSDIPFLPYAFLAIVRIPLSCIYTLELVDYKMRRQSKKYFHLSVTNGMMVTSLMVLFVVLFKWGAFGNLSASLTATTFLFGFVIYRNRGLLSIPMNWNTVREAAMFCWPIVIASMLAFFSTGYDKVMLERTGDLTMLGYYSVGVSIAAYVNVFSDSINSTFQSDIFENIVKRDFRKTFMIVAMKLAMTLLIVGCFILLAPYIIDILTYGRYVNSTKFAIITSLASITSMLYYTVSQIAIAFGYSSITLINKILGSVLSVVTYHVIIEQYGATGAAWGMVVSYIYLFLGGSVMVASKYYLNKRKH